MGTLNMVCLMTHLFSRGIAVGSPNPYLMNHHSHIWSKYKTNMLVVSQIPYTINVSGIFMFACGETYLCYATLRSASSLYA